MTSGILVYAETSDSRIHPVSFELLGKAREIAEKLGLEVWSVIIGFDVKDRAKELIYYGADKVYVYDSEHLKDFNVLTYKDILVDLVKEIDPEIFLIGATPLGRSLAPRVAAALDTGLTADCTDLRVDEEGNLIQIRPAFTGNILAHIKTTSKPIMSTIRYKVMPMPKRDESRKGEIVIKNPPEKIDTRIKSLGRISKRTVNIADAEVIVSGGRGLKNKEDLKMLEELAKLLGGVLGVSRPLVDEGWIAKEHQVGFSGNTVKPKLYIACGISGSPQHLAGMRDSQIIVAINIDPSAPIFRHADYGVVGDLYEVVPKLISMIKRIKGVSGS
ncbi:MAG: electron transfer flavoprotein subunit alpha/FixB family protein [Candidatus Wolframiiraptor sp.]|nr:MAG: electron transfer flavoprotein subunit alpha/FixB family protein [Candidatus Wolframiiraptor sp.]